MKHNKMSGAVQMEAAESEGDILDKYQPSDGFSDVMNEFDMHETRMAINGRGGGGTNNSKMAMMMQPPPMIEMVN